MRDHFSRFVLVPLTAVLLAGVSELLLTESVPLVFAEEVQATTEAPAIELQPKPEIGEKIEAPPEQPQDGVSERAVRDTIPPTGAISTPKPGTVVQGTMLIDVQAKDNVGIKNVQILVDGSPGFCKLENNAPYTCNWDTRQVRDGAHMVSAVIRDTANNMTTAAQVSVVVQNQGGIQSPGPNQAITGAISTPMPGSAVKGTVLIDVQARSAAPIQDVQILVDGNPALCALEKNAPYTCNLETRKVKDGSHVLSAVIRDTANNAVTTAAVVVMVQNQTTAQTPLPGPQPGPQPQQKPTGAAQAATQSNGQPCRADSDCLSNSCYPYPPTGQNFCTRQDLHCALPGREGAYYKTVIGVNGIGYQGFADFTPLPSFSGGFESINPPLPDVKGGSAYRCQNPGDGRATWLPRGIAVGVSCNSGADCQSGACGPDVPDPKTGTSNNYCRAQNMQCALPNSPGAANGQTTMRGQDIPQGAGPYTTRVIMTYQCQQVSGTGRWVAQVGAKADGQVCTRREDCQSSNCAAYPDGKLYCLGKYSTGEYYQCPMPGKSGVGPDTDIVVDLARYICHGGGGYGQWIQVGTAPPGSPGAQCTTPSDCQAQRCVPHYNGRSYCVGPDTTRGVPYYFDCPIPGKSDGVRAGDVVVVSDPPGSGGLGTQYQCRGSGVGWQFLAKVKQGGALCSIGGNDCESGKCWRYPPDNRTYCLGKTSGLSCPLPGMPGLEPDKGNFVTGCDGQTYECVGGVGWSINGGGISYQLLQCLTP